MDASFGLLGRGPQLFSLTGVPAPGVSTDELAEGLKAQLRRVAEHGVQEDELQRVKTQWRASDVYKRDSVFGQAQELGSYWVQGLGLDGGDRLMAALDTITPADVQRVATRYFSDDQLTTGVLVPAQP